MESWADESDIRKILADCQTWAVVAGSVFWLGIMLALTMGDYLTRGWRTYG